MAQTELIEIDELVDEIVARLLALSNLKAENVRNVRREFSKRLANTSPQIVIALSLRLLQLGRPGFEYRFVAYELVCHHKAALRSLVEVSQAGGMWTPSPAIWQGLRGVNTRCQMN